MMGRDLIAVYGRAYPIITAFVFVAGIVAALIGQRDLRHLRPLKPWS